VENEPPSTSQKSDPGPFRSWTDEDSDADCADAVVPVVAFSFPIWRSFKIEEGRLAFNWPENALRRSQDLPKAFHDCGQFYFVRTEPFLAQRRVIMDHTVPIIVPEEEAQDIDTEDDWKIAEIKYSLLLERRTS